MRRLRDSDMIPSVLASGAGAVAMSSAKKLQQSVPMRRTAWKLADLVVLFLLLALLAHRASSLLGAAVAEQRCWLAVAALFCEAWFTLLWLLNMNCKWNPVRFETYPDRLSERSDELPAVDVFVTTADPELEPPVVTVNTMLSLLALDYPAGKLACYVSDDGCSPLTCYALREAAGFAGLWVPFCRRHGVGVRAPFVYFYSGPEPGMADQEFLREWTFIKNEYDKLVGRIEKAEECSLAQSDNEFIDFIGVDRRNHPTIIKILWDNSNSKTEGFPSLIYVSREKSPKSHHHFKAGSMNVLETTSSRISLKNQLLEKDLSSNRVGKKTRVSAVLTNAPIMLNVDCDMFANNPQVILHAMCLLLGFDDEVHSGFVQAPQIFYNALLDDPFGIRRKLCTRNLDMDLLDFKEFIIMVQVVFTEGKSFTACHQTAPHMSNQ